MPIPADINDLSTTAGSNGPAGSETPTDGDGYLRAHASFIATLRDKLDGTSDTGTIKNATFSGTMAGAASWSGLQTFAGGIAGDGVATIVSAAKSATTSRTSSTASDDPHLTLALTAGVWAVKGLLQIAEDAVGNDGGLKAALAFTGTATGYWSANGSAAGSAVRTGLSAVGSTATIINTSMNPLSSALDWLEIVGYVSVSVAGNLKFQWAQLTADANGTNILVGSWLSATKVA